MPVKFRLDTRNWGRYADEVQKLGNVDIPSFRLSFARLAGRTAVTEVNDWYRGRPGLASSRHRLPVVHTGHYGQKVRLRIGPYARWFGVYAESPYADIVEFGGPPTMVNFAELEEWAELKLGVDAGSRQGRAAVRTIWNNIRKRGHIATFLMHRALASPIFRTQIEQLARTMWTELVEFRRIRGL